MKRLIAIGLFAGIAAAGLAGAADSGGKTAAKVNVGTLKSMNPATGRFHKIHTQQLKMACESCHSSEPPAPGEPWLRKDEPLPKGMPGRVAQEPCLACHKPGGPGPRFYGAAK